ncbi:MAG: FUSC family protein [Deltaproteobacteria bacterium]|jgi:uncharacterized membrane protein YgaE (UPF0421/DUF939 family)|nr:FUSC family protein [Deltaproteobacteria bacterium]
MMSYNALRIAIMVALVALASYIVGFYTTGLFHGATAGIGGLWSAISGIVVLQATRHAAWSSASLRVLGTAIGSIISAAYLTVLPFSPYGMAASIFATVLLCHVVRIPDHARLASITVAVIMVTASLNPTITPILNAALRFSESCIGTALAVFAVLLWPGEKAPLNTDQTLLR